MFVSVHKGSVASMHVGFNEGGVVYVLGCFSKRYLLVVFKGGVSSVN